MARPVSAIAEIIEGAVVPRVIGVPGPIVVVVREVHGVLHPLVVMVPPSSILTAAFHHVDNLWDGLTHFHEKFQHGMA